MAASEEKEFNLMRIRGINPIKLISNPNQAINQELVDTAMIVPEKTNIINMMWKFLNNIKKKEVYNSHRRGMNPLA